jgi:hypothetical protein
MQDASVSNPNLVLDERMAALEAEWSQVYEASMVARTDLERLQGCGDANVGLVHVARSRLERFEALKACVMQEIERLEESVLSVVRVGSGS